MAKNSQTPIAEKARILSAGFHFTPVMETAVEDTISFGFLSLPS